MRCAGRRYLMPALAVPLGLALVWFMVGHNSQQAATGSPLDLAAEMAIELGEASVSFETRQSPWPNTVWRSSRLGRRIVNTPSR